MNSSRSLVLLGLSTFLLFGCQTAANDISAVPGDSAVQLSAEEEALSSLEASFMSEKQTFAYAFTYDGNLVELMGDEVVGAAGYGPRFQVQGGAEVLGSTGWLKEMEEGSVFSATRLFGANEVEIRSSAEKDCTITKGLVPFGEEALVLELRVCAGDDEALAGKAFEELLGGVSLETL